MNYIKAHNLLVLLLLYNIYSIEVWAQTGFLPRGAAALGQGEASMFQADAWVALNQPAAGAAASKAALGMEYRNRFGIAGLAEASLGLVLPVGKHAASLGAAFSGAKEMRIMECIGAYAIQPTRSLRIGIGIQWLRIESVGAKALNKATARLGLLYAPLRKLEIGVLLLNPIPYRLNAETGERLPVVMRIGMQYRPMDQVHLVAEYEQRIYSPSIFRLGLGYRPHTLVMIRAGFRSAPPSPSLGIGLMTRYAVLEVSSNWQQVLGFSPSASLQFPFTLQRKAHE